MKRWIPLIAWCMLMLPAPIAAAPAEPDDREHVKRLVQRLDQDPAQVESLIQRFEKDPWADESEPLAAVLSRYLIESDKVEVHVDPDVIAPILTDRSDMNFRLVVLYNNGLLAYALQHGGKAGRSDETSTVALKSMVRGYRNMLKARPTSKSAFADRLVKLDARNDLASWLREARAAKKAP